MDCIYILEPSLIDIHNDSLVYCFELKIELTISFSLSTQLFNIKQEILLIITSKTKKNTKSLTDRVFVIQVLCNTHTHTLTHIYDDDH